ncbi:MAG: molybdopterin biosynthesis protein [Syntrophomonas sp.]
MKRNIYIENKPLEEARELFTSRLEDCGYFKPKAEEISTLQAYNRISASAIYARRSAPHYVASAMDGIAVAAIETESANDLNPLTLSSDQYLEVDTGDYVPPQFDSVIMIEDVNLSEGGARIIKPAVPWQHIRSIGEDLVAQDMIVSSGFKLGPYEIASLLTAAVEQVSVVKKPLVYVIPTGSELVERGSQDMAPGEIVESNSYMLAGLACEWGADVIRHDIVPDDPALLTEALREAVSQADLVVMCSGSSAGREDYTAELIEQMGELLVHGLAMRPGKPAILGIIEGKPVIGVPGYPISAQLVFNLFARPLLYRKQGIQAPEPEAVEARMARKIASHMGVDEFIYVNLARIQDKYVAYPLNRGAGITTSLVKADGIALIPRGQEGCQAGEIYPVRLMRSRGIIDKNIVAIGSHDLSIDFLADLLARNHSLRLISANVGSMGGLMALMRGEVHFAGIHLLDPATGEYNLNYLERHMSGRAWLLVNLAIREQGLIVKKGNPLGIKGLADLTRKGVRYINRQKGSGTRILLDYLLGQNRITSNEINGYNREEYTHLAVAASVKNNACDTGLGIYASARAMNLDFIPIAEEMYDMCILPEVIGAERLEYLLEIIRGSELGMLLQKAGGYRLKLTGQVRAANKL